MSVSTEVTCPEPTNRPVGVIGSDDAVAQRAERALSDRRLDDAKRNVQSLRDRTPVERFWKSLLQSAVMMACDRLSEAEGWAWQAVGFASALPLIEHDDKNDVNCQRWIGRALNQLGTIARRREDGDAALELHAAALRLRARYGSIEEQWESLIECAIDADLNGDTEQAVDRLVQAVSLGREAVEEPLVKQAIARDHLCRIYQKLNRHAEAIESARSARALWHNHDPGAAAVARADVQLGSALITGAVARRQPGEPCHASALMEAEELLSVAGEALAAFGGTHEAEARWAREQRDFARRLREDAGYCD